MGGQDIFEGQALLRMASFIPSVFFFFLLASRRKVVLFKTDICSESDIAILLFSCFHQHLAMDEVLSRGMAGTRTVHLCGMSVPPLLHLRSKAVIRESPLLHPLSLAVASSLFFLSETQP